jgi:hypothetical protein
MSLVDRVRAAAGAASGTSPAVAPGATATGFDHVEVPSKGDDDPRRLDKRQFEALPLQERIGLLVQGTLRFYRGDKEVSACEAMRANY